MINLTKFCADEEGRYAITDPWQYEKHVYATDGRIAVRVPTFKGFKESGNPQQRPKAYQLFNSAIQTRGAMQFLECDTTHEIRKCICVEKERCETCDQELEYGDEISRPNCRWCEGNGRAELFKKKYTQVNSAWFTTRYLWLILQQCEKVKCFVPPAFKPITLVKKHKAKATSKPSKKKAPLAKAKSAKRKALAGAK